MVSIKQLTDDLIRDEGMVLHAYKDHLGFLTIGIGRLIDERRGGGITEEEAKYLLQNDINYRITGLRSKLSWFDSQPEQVQRALVNMSFQLGINGLLGFRNTLAYIEQRNYKKAAENARKSNWYKQTPNRAERVIALIESAQV